MNEKEWLESKLPEPMLNYLREVDSSRKMRLFAVACCWRIKDLLDDRSLHALAVVERHIEGAATDDELRNAYLEAEEAFRLRKRHVLSSMVGEELVRQAEGNPRGLYAFTDRQTAGKAHDAADDDRLALAASSVWTAATSEKDLEASGYSMVDIAIGTAIQVVMAVSERKAEDQAQGEIVRDIFGNPFISVSFVPEWLTPSLVTLAKNIYDKREFRSLPDLAIVLEQGGCNCQRILAHCREAIPHVRGCWVVDSILAKS
jgi:hypothetical protein